MRPDAGPGTGDDAGLETVRRASYVLPLRRQAPSTSTELDELTDYVCALPGRRRQRPCPGADARSVLLDIPVEEAA